MGTMTDKAKALAERLRVIPDRHGMMYEDYDDVIEAADEIKRLCDILEQWLSTAREHLDTEVAGRTFEALRKNSHD